MGLVWGLGWVECLIVMVVWILCCCFGLKLVKLVLSSMRMCLYVFLVVICSRVVGEVEVGGLWGM